MNLIKDFERDIASRKVKISFSADQVQHLTVGSENGQKSGDKAVDLELQMCLLRLRFLIQDIRLPDDSSVAGLKRLASALNAEMSPMKTWGWRYIHQVSSKGMPPSKKLRRAIYLLYVKRTLKGVIPLEQVTVLAPVGFVQMNSTLRIRSRECARTACSISFIPSRSNHIYCCRECGRHSRREKRNNITRRKKWLRAKLNQF